MDGEKEYEIIGEYKINKQNKKYTKNIKAINENMAKEKIYTEIGAKQKIKRRDITIKEIKILN